MEQKLSLFPSKHFPPNSLQLLCFYIFSFLILLYISSKYQSVFDVFKAS